MFQKLLNMTAEKNKYHLVIQTAFIGDILLAIPTLKKIKALYPNHKLALVTRSGLKSFLLNEKIVDVVYEIKKGDSSSYEKILIEIQTLSIDTVYCLHRSLRSTFFATKIKAQKKIGFSNIWNKILFQKTIAYKKEWPDVIRQMAILHYDQPEFLNFEFDYSVYNKKTTSIPDHFLFSTTKNKRIKTGKIVLFPGSVWATKQWGLNNYIELAKKLILSGYQVDVMGGTGEVALAEKIKSQVPEVTVWAGLLNLNQSIDKLSEYDMVICNDSSPNHMAAYKNKPVVTVFGPTTLDLGFRPWINEARVVENEKLSCRPCGKHGHKQCPLKHHQCMTTISVDQVFQHVQQLHQEVYHE